MCIVRGLVVCEASVEEGSLSQSAKPRGDIANVSASPDLEDVLHKKKYRLRLFLAGEGP